MNSKERLCKLKDTQIRRKHQHVEQKKQVRRRRKTHRPYKERLLNTAEARREIATALKFHRASMKEASERQQKQGQQIKEASLLLPQLYPCFESEGRMKSWRNPRIYPGSSCDCSYYLDHLSNFSDVTSLDYISWSSSPIAPPPVAENIQVELPVQTLGLNLNFHHFKSMDSVVVCNDSHPFHSPSFLSPSSYSYGTHQEVPRSITFAEEGELIASGVLDSKIPTGEGKKDLERAVDEKEMAEFRSSREQHQKAMEIQEDSDTKAVEIDGHCTFDEETEFPAWLSINDNCLPQHLNYHGSEDNFQDPDLSCMDLGEIEDVDGDWLA